MKESIIAQLIGIEGAYGDDPADAGGPTKYGVTEAAARAFGYKGKMEDLPYGTAVDIYEDGFWKPLKLDAVGDFSYGLAERLFNVAVHCGPEAAAEWLQRCLNVLNRGERDYADVEADGVIGKKTLAALSEFASRRGTEGLGYLAKAVSCLQGAFYIELAERRPTDEKFLNGWLRARL